LKPIRIGNAWVVGAVSKNYFKMVSFDANGKQIESRYASKSSKLSKNTWDKARKTGKYVYNVEDVVSPSDSGKEP
jgi:hypothetical protein